ncbi:MAG: hypothetical protein IKC02_02130, partial [Oscillospiraceae bacterium]|nr:hypothetical protein [Oscillospiraceae bacterium]
APQQKKKTSHHRKRGPSKPKASQSGEAKAPQSKQSEQKKAPQSKTPAPQASKAPQTGGEKSAASAPKKKNNYHRYRGKPKNKAPGGAAPKG